MKTAILLSGAMCLILFATVSTATPLEEPLASQASEPQAKETPEPQVANSPSKKSGPKAERKLYVAMKGIVYGPYSMNRVYAFIQEGRVLSSTLIAEAGSDKWFPASSIFYFASRAASASQLEYEAPPNGTNDLDARRPHRGIGWIVSGGGIVVGSGLYMISLLLIDQSLFSVENSYYLPGAVVCAGGIGMFIGGLYQLSKYNKWKKNHLATGYIKLMASPSAAGFYWQTAF